MSKRPDWDEYFLKMAYVVATRATCDRKHVGAILVDDDNRIVATGYNGSPAGAPHCDDVGHLMVNMGGRESCIRTLHAESNVLDYAGAFARDCTLYVTVTPCFDCAKRIVNSGVVRVVWNEHYESRYNQSSTVIDFLRSCGVDVQGPGPYSRAVDYFRELIERAKPFHLVVEHPEPEKIS